MIGRAEDMSCSSPVIAVDEQITACINGPHCQSDAGGQILRWQEMLSTNTAPHSAGSSYMHECVVGGGVGESLQENAVVVVYSCIWVALGSFG